VHVEQRALADFIDSTHKSVSNLLFEIKNRDEDILKNVWLAFFNTPINTDVEKRALKEGVRGFFYERDSRDLFVKGINTLCRGQLWISREILSNYILDGEKESAKKPIQPPKNLKLHLTQREIEILALVTVGAKNEDIAEKLFISPHTVKTHLYNVFKKIDVKNRFQAALWAADHINK
jgi:DNA-binding NarL/FixJ family response regulator